MLWWIAKIVWALFVEAFCMVLKWLRGESSCRNTARREFCISAEIDLRWREDLHAERQKSDLDVLYDYLAVRKLPTK